MEDQEIVEVMRALKYALREVKDRTVKHLVAAEFWNSMNRRGFVDNENVDPLIGITVSK